jgi:hypothetical protein
MLPIWSTLDKIIDGIELKQNESITINDDYEYPLMTAMRKYKEGKQEWTSK